MIFNLCLIIITFIIYLFVSNFKNIEKNKRNSIFLRIMFIIFFILVASREMTIGNDTQMYLNLFKKCSLLKWDAVSFDGYFEGGYLIFNVLLSYISSSSRFFMIIMSFIFNFVCYYFIKNNSKNYLLSIVMYICLLYLYTSMTMMRQYLALMIVLSSFIFIKNKKPLKFFMSILFASFFHSSVWLALLIYPLYNAKYSKTRVMIILGISVIITIYIGPFINFIYGLLGRTNYYIDRIGSDNLANTLYTCVYLVMYLFSIYEIRKKTNSRTKKFEKENGFYLYSLLFALCINLIATNMNVLSRAALYFEFFSIIAFPNIIENNIIKINNKKFINLLVYFCLIIYSSTIIYFRPEWNSAFNYKSCIIVNSGDICN